MKYDLILAISSVFCIMLQLFALYFILMFPSFMILIRAANQIV